MVKIMKREFGHLLLTESIDGSIYGTWKSTLTRGVCTINAILTYDMYKNVYIVYEMWLYFD